MRSALRRRAMRSPTSKDLVRYSAVRHHGVSIEELAVRQNVLEKSVQDSIDRVEAYKFVNSEEILQAKSFEMGIEILPAMEKVFTDAMEAVHILEDGSHLPDHKTRLEATGKVKDFLEIFQKRGPSVSTSVNVGIQNNASLTGGRSLEGIVRAETRRQVEQRVSIQQPPFLAAGSQDDILDAEIEDVEIIDGKAPIEGEDQDPDDEPSQEGEPDNDDADGVSEEDDTEDLPDGPIPAQAGD